MSLASRKLIQATAGATTVDTGDDDFANVVLLLDGDGTSDDNNNTFTDSSTNGFTVTENGSVVQGSFSPYGDNWSNSFDGDSDALTIPDSTDFDFGTGDFTMEAWIYPRSLNDANDYNSIVSAHNPTAGSPAAGESWLFTVLNNQKLTVYGSGGTTSSSNATVSLNEWSHVMITRSSGTIRFFINGTLDTNTPSVTGNFNCTSAGLAIGRQANPNVTNTRYWDGWISNVRLVKGTALQTSSFTPSTSPLTAVTNTVLLACQSNRFVDNSSSSHTLTPTGTVAVTPFSPFKDDDARDITTDGGSAYFDGSSYLSSATSSDYAFGTGDFTVQGWIYPTSDTNFDAIFNNDGASAGTFFLYRHTNGYIDSWIYGDPALSTTNVYVPKFAWTHVLASRSGTTLSCWVNGQLESSYTTSRSVTKTTALVGRTFSGDNANCYLADVRVEKGTGVSSAPSIPTAPISTVTDTKLLLNFQDAGIYDRSGINNLDTVGNAQIDTAVKKYGTGSIEFDGSGDYLQTVAGSEPLYFTGQDFTVEGWVYLNNLSSNHTCFYYGDTNRSTSNASGIAFEVFYRSSDGYFRANQYYSSTGGFGGSNTLVTPAATQWYHVAYYRIGSQFYLAVNGNVANIGSFTQPLLNGASWVFRAGLESDSVGDPLNGYLDDIRITMGKARYGTSNFTPPDEALPKF